jgi:predicted MPP superfamily phosphohydrolase
MILAGSTMKDEVFLAQGDATTEWATGRRAMEASRYRSGPDGPRLRRRHRLFSALLKVFGCSLRLTPFYRRGVRNALDLRLTAFEVSLAGLPPAFDGYRILHVSDTHLDNLPAIAEVAGRMLDGVEIDLLALTGDVHGLARHPISLSVDLLARALNGLRVRDRKLAVLGNHDSADMPAALQRLGFEVLVNRSMMLTRNSDTIRVTGLDDVHSFYTPQARAALEAKAEGFRIALVHSPEMADHAAAAGYALYLCGHTHGGQICLPGGRIVFSQLVRCHHAASGLWREGNMVGYTTTGLGVSAPTVRFNTRGEAALITLRCPRP